MRDLERDRECVCVYGCASGRVDVTKKRGRGSQQKKKKHLYREKKLVKTG